jgi:glutamate-ammonia-ligase adenylyltransferase
VFEANPHVVELVERSADPERVRSALDRLGHDQPDALDEVLDDDDAAVALVAVLAASRSLTRVLQTDAAALPALTHLDERPAPPEGMDAVVGWERRELLRIAARDLTGLDELEVTTDRLAELASHVLRAAVREALEHDRTGVELAVIGMGKLGGSELNYASDIDVLFVGEGDQAALGRAARSVLEHAGRCYRVDADLRPEGRDGPLVRSLASYEAYWARWADPWERQALLKAVPVAGHGELGARWGEAAGRMVWDRPFSADDLRYVRAMKVRAEEEVVRRGIAEREVKRGPGGIRDIEFSAQLLQLVHGPDDAELRTPSTLPAIDALTAGGYVDPEDAGVLRATYRFLRRVEHVLQLDDERQTHTVPADRVERRRVARVLGFTGTPAAGATEAFDAALASQRTQVRTAHERVWFRPLLDALSGAGRLDPDAAADRLEAFGFTDVERTRQAVTELTRGLTRSSRMMRQLLPLLLDWLSSSPNPDLGLLGLRRIAAGDRRAAELANAFRDSPEVARHLALVLGTSRLLGDVLLANPDLIERLPDPDRLRTQARRQLVESAVAGISWRPDMDERQRALQRWKQRNLLGVAARDLFGEADVRTVGVDLTALAEAALEAGLASLDPQVPMAVIAFGRFGGGELGYASDLDIAFVHDGSSPGAGEEADRVAMGLLRFVGGSTPAEQIWAVDPTLRPEGRNGPLTRSMEGWAAYLERWASTWERQAYLRVRVVAGDSSLGDDLVARIADAIWARSLTEAEAREIRRMKVRIEQERIPAGEDPEFHLKLGLGSLSDVEWTVQLLQLRHGVPGAATMGALDALVSAGHLPADEAAILEESYRFCEGARNRSFLVNGLGDALPTRPEQIIPLARSLGCTVTELRDEYRRVTRRARRVVEHRFYEQG